MEKWILSTINTANGKNGFPRTPHTGYDQGTDARLNGKDVSVSGNVEINGINIYNCSEKELKDYRSSIFSIAFQNARDIFNPLLKIREQIFENFKGKLDKKEIMETRIRRHPKRESGKIGRAHV